MLTTYLLPCAAATGNVSTAVGFASLALGVTGLLIILIFCRECICAPIPKLLGQFLIITGFIFGMFTVLTPALCGVPVGLYVPLALALFGTLFLWLWYQANKLICPLSICHFYAALIQAFHWAIVGCTVVFFACVGQCSALGWLAMIFLLLVLTILFNQLIAKNQNIGACPNYP